VNRSDRSMEQRLDELEKIQAVKEVKQRYWTAWDNKDVVALVSVFSAGEVHIDYGPGFQFDRREGLAQALTEQASHQTDGAYDIVNFHDGMYPGIRILSDSMAHGAWTVRFREINAVTRTEMLSSGRCEDDYVLEAGEWKIRRTVFMGSWAVKRPMSGEVVFAPRVAL
jgi:SnoaL-like protein